MLFRLGPITITSEVGNRVRVAKPWQCEVVVINQSGKLHPRAIEDGEFICFGTDTGRRREVPPVA